MKTKANRTMRTLGHLAAAIFFAVLSSAVVAQERADPAANDTAAPLERPRSQSDASGAPEPSAAAAQARAAERANASPNTSDYYLAAQAAYKSALHKAQSDHKAALLECRELAKTEQRSCEDEADARLKLAKSEATRLKPAS